MSENITVTTVSSQSASSQTLTNVTSNDPKDLGHCRGPLDGSLYAKVTKNKKSEDVDANHVTEESLHESEEPNSLTNYAPEKNEATNKKSPNVVVLHGSRIVYKPQPKLGFDPQNFCAPLATLSEFNSSYLSIVSSRDSVPSLTSVTKLSLTSSPSVKSHKRMDMAEENSGSMTDGSTRQTASHIVDDVIKKCSLTKAGNDVKNQNARFSEISSCSAITLSSTSTEDGGGPHPELSDNDTSSESSLSDLDGNLSPGTVKGNLSPETLLEKVLGDVEESEPSLFFESEIHPEAEVKCPIPQFGPVVKEPFETLPPPAVAPPVVPQSLVGSSDQEDMYNGVNGSYNKGLEYSVPMRDMKITTIPSKRAVLVSTGNESDDIAAQTSDRRGSVYDDGNSYQGAGYATIEEYSGNGPIGIESPPAEEHSYIPDDVQELLNGLQEGPTCSDIDSGFHGSSMALQHSSKTTNDYDNVTSLSSSELSDPFSSPPPSQSNDPSPVYDGSYPVGSTSSREGPVQAVSVATKNFYQNVGSELKVQAVAASTTRKNLNPGIPIPTQTMPEPQPAKVQIITMTNVYTNDQGIPLNSLGDPRLVPNVSTHSSSIHASTSREYKQELNEEPHAVAMRINESPVETVSLRKATVEAATSPVKSDAALKTPETVTMETGDETIDLYIDDDIEDKLDCENIESVEEQINHAQKHLEFLKEQQEKLVKRKQDRTKYREIKRNSSAFESHSQGHNFALGTSATVRRKPYQPAEEAEPRVAVQSQTLQKTRTPKAQFQQYEKKMPPITTVEQRVAALPVQQTPPPENAWNATHPKVTRQASDINHDRYGPVQPSLPAKKQPIRKQENCDIIMSSDLQEQLAELDKCIAELTTSMDIPLSDATPQSTQEPSVALRHRSYTLDIERKMDPNVPETNSNTSSSLSPPAKSGSSFDSYKRLSQEFDHNEKSKSLDQGIDDVFTPGPQVPRKKKQSAFPPQTSATRHVHSAPAPPPKRRISLEESLSPGLMEALALNPGAKPKEDIHSYKEDLAPETSVPETPTFPISPGTPYVNNESPMRVKSPPGLAKTPLSALHLKPKEKPMEWLHHVETRNKSEETSDSPTTPPQDVVDGKMFVPNNKQSPVSEPAVVQSMVVMPNEHAKETALLHDGIQRPVVSSTPKQKEVNAPPQYMMNGQNHTGYLLSNNATMPAKAVQVQREISQQQGQPVSPPSYLSLPHTNLAPTNLHSIPQQQTVHVPEPTTPQQYLLNDSGRSHSSHSHSPAATSSNSRHGSSDSLDGTSTRHSNSSILSSSSSSSAHHPGFHVMSPNNVMRPGSQLSNYERHLLPPGPASGHRSGDESLGSTHSGRTSSSSISDVEKMNYDVSHATVSAAPKFIRDTTAYWYKPDIARDQALAILRSKPAGTFVVRDSRCFPGAFGLALKVDKLPPGVQAKPGADIANEYVRHFLIETSSRGVRLKGCPNEPVFGSLSALVYQHSITPLALPCRLIIPTADQEIPQPGNNTPRQSLAETPTATSAPANSVQGLLKQGAACNVIYIGSVDTESLTGPPAIERAVRETFQIAKANLNMTSIVHFKVSPQGITLTDNARKIFFRRHYPTETVTFCGMDPLGGANKGQRRWDATPMRGGPDAWLFGFVARKQAGARDNACHVFAELDPAQPARAIVNFVMKILIGSTRQNSS